MKKQRKRQNITSIERFLAIFLIVVVCLVVCIPTVSAFEFDNVKSYDYEKSEITIKNSILGIPFLELDTVAKIKLNTPHHYYVPLGYQKIAEFDLSVYEDYELSFKELELFDKKDNERKFTRDYDYKYKTIDDVVVNDYEEQCVKGSCEYVVVGNHTEKGEVWIDIKNYNFLKDTTLTIGIFMNIEKGDHIEWIPNYFGVRIEEWAEVEGSYIGKWSLHASNTDSYGITTNNTHVWVVDTVDDEVYVYLVNGTYVTSWDTSSETLTPNSITTNNTFIWVSNGSGNSMLVYDMNGVYQSDFWTTQGAHTTQADAGNNGTHVWITDHGNDIAYGYLINGSEIAGNNFATTNNAIPIGLDINESWIWIVEVGDNDMHRYDHSGNWNSSWDLASSGMGNALGMGIGENDTAGTFYIVDSGTNEIFMFFAYPISTTPPDNPPSITLNSPTADINYTSSQIITFNFTASDDRELSNVKLYIDGELNQTNASGINNSIYLFDLSLKDGDYTINGVAEDNESETTNSSSIRIVIDSIKPTLIIALNTSIIYTVGDSIQLNTTITDTNLDSCWYNYNDTNTTIEGCVTATINQTDITTVVGKTNITVYANDTLGNKDSSLVSFVYDSTAPTITIETPSETLDYNIVGENETLNVTFTDSSLGSCWYNYNGTNITIPGCLTTVKNSTLFLLESGNTNMTIYVNDTIGNENSSFIDWDYKLLKDSEVYDTIVMEGETSTFKINLITNGSSITIASLFYNGKSYVGSISNSGNNYTITKNKNIPSVSTDTNISFYWNITTNEGYIKSIDSKNQTIYNININESCGTGRYPIYNFTLVDEITQAIINKTTEDTSIIMSLNLYNSDKSLSLLNYSHDYSQINPAAVCISNNLSGGASYSMDMQVQYLGTNYSTEYYNIRRYVLNSSTIGQEVNLYNLAKVNTQSFKLIARDSSYLPLDEALIQIDRKYLENGTFYTIEIPLTDYNGITSASLQTESVIYTFYVYDSDGVLVYSFKNVRAICQTPLVDECTIDFNAFQTGITIPDSDDQDFTFTLGYNETSRTITTTFTIPSGTPQTILLQITSEDTLGTSVCSDTLTSASGTLSCLVPSNFGNSTIKAVVYKNSIEQGRGTIKLDQKSSDIFGVILVFLSLLIAMTLIGMGISDNPVITAVFLFVGVLLLVALNLIQNNGFIGATSSILFIAIAVVLIIIKAGRRT